MPITFKTCDKKPEKFGGEAKDFKSLFQDFSLYQQEAAGEILQHSGNNGPAYDAHWENGFLGSIFQAYCQHHNLSIRPDDVWLAILTQFSLYLNANAEKFRKEFVSHDGQEELVVRQAATLHTADYASLAKNMTEVMQQHMTDDGAKKWILPNFTTTTENDIVVGSFIMMSAMQSYFKYIFVLECGIPEITLQGTIEDWKNILVRTQRFQKYEDPILNEWCTMLTIILGEFINAMDNKINLDFWSKICHHISGGSGPSYLSGWITAFNVFNEKGKWRGNQKSIERFGKTIANDIFPIIDTDEIIPGMVSVPIIIDDNGIKYKSKAFGGHLAMNVSTNGMQLSPRLDWIIALVDEKKIKK